MVRRILGIGLFAAAVAGLFVSCSSEDSGGSPTGGGGSGGTVVPDGASPDVEPEAEPVETGTQDVMEAAPLSCPAGSWGNVPSTKCDLIEQECSNGLTCYPNVLNGKPGTSCTFIGNGMKVKGQACEESTECAQGLVCIMKFCAPFCCPDLQYELCGPGGLCNINLQVSSTYRVMVCSYAKACTLWADDCPPDEGCQPVGTDGSSACTEPASGAFVGEGQPCDSKNDCGDSQACIGGVGSAPGICRYLCKLGDTPFDAGVQGGEPGKGGCLDGQTCKPMSDSPSWLGVCTTD